jgi:RNA polymerase sigma-70 factor (ECF subfamily)
MLARALDALHRRDGGRLLALLIRQFRSFDVAEDALHDAYAKALQRWPSDGVPDNPAAWIATVARRCVLDRLKHERRNVSFDCAQVATFEALDMTGMDDVSSPIPDERLALIFMCCHPAIAQPAQVALTLHSLCGLTTREIARAFVEPEPTTAQQLTRVKRKIAQAGIAFEMPDADEFAARLASVLAVIYFVFNEGYVASTGNDLLHPNLCAEAIRLGRLLDDLLPEQGEAAGLLALMLLHESRRDARADTDGVLVVLEDQVRSSWNPVLIAEATAAQTDWLQISALYSALLRHLPTPVVELNAAVALAMSTSIDDGLKWIDRIEQSGALDQYHLLHAAKGDLLRRSGRTEVARTHYLRARDLAKNRAERCYLERRILELSKAQ